MGFLLRLTFLPLLVCASVPGFQQETGSADSEREKDVYAIYSLMLTNPRTSHGPDENERFLIAAATSPGRPPEPCVVPPKERAGAFREVLADYERRRNTPRQLKPALSIRKPYVLLSAGGIKEFMEERSLPSPEHQKTPSERFRGIADVFSVSDVYFNRKRTLALSSLSSWCGSLCGMSQWRVVEKLNGHWEERPWIGCVTIA